MSRALPRTLAALAVLATARLAGGADEPAAEFYRAFNLNGPALAIDGRPWEAGDAPGLVVRADAFENQGVPLVPPTDPERARMIRSSRWGGHAEVRVEGVPDGPCQVFLYVWEDNDAERFTIRLNGREVALDHDSGATGSWSRLGPWPVEVDSGTIALTADGGAANLSGLEIWRGRGAVPDPTRPPPDRVRPRDEASATRFDAEVAPILARRCLECHGGSQREGKLSLATERGALEGGATGPAVVPGDPDESWLWIHVESDEMPKGRPPLGESEKQVLKRWIADGAGWGMDRIDPFLATTDRRAGYDWWSLQPVQDPPVPTVSRADWPRNDLDRFVLEGLEARGLSPSPEADRRTLIRRVAFDLTGLPPSPEEVEAFVDDPDPSAYEHLVDRLLDSPHYGERWARHWLDVIRFGESQGFERNHVRDDAWKFRDWVVDAFNRDLPYDEFVRQQLAGDVLRPGDRSALIATGYLVCGTWDQVAHLEGSEMMKRAARQDELEDLVGAYGQAFLGLTINCARCHDHKFDPIAQAEYYQIAAALSGVTQEEQEREIAGGERVHAVIPKQPQPTALLERGDFRNPREIVRPAGLKALAGLDPDFGLAPDAPEADRRRALAEWTADRRNPLTARVFVNRLWHGHFGRGLVETPSDFGFNGGRPAHPDLLDWLASRFVEGGWKVKPIQRLIVTSATYRQASRATDDRAVAIDADNRWLWRADRRRLEGEAVRDAMLVVAGALNDRPGGPSYRDVTMKVGSNNNHEFTDPTGEFTDETNRRTLYRLWARSGNLPLLESLDCPDPSVMAPRRTQTITPVQALAMENDAFVERCAARAADRIRSEAGDDPGRQVDRAWRLALGRPPSDREAEPARAFAGRRGLDQLMIVLFNTNEFLFVD
jgi:hypothetical protein